MVVAPSNTNRALSFRGPTIKLPHRRIVTGSCREAVLAALNADADADAEHLIRASTEVHNLLVEGGATWSRQTVYKTMHRMVRDGLLIRAGGRFALATPE